MVVDALFDAGARHGWRDTLALYNPKTTAAHPERAAGAHRPETSAASVVYRTAAEDGAGSLDIEEWREMHSHPERGQRIVLAIGVEGVEEIALAVRHHHECFDGSGYPDCLHGEDIPFTARMLAIADAYDAMGVPKPYQQRRGHEQIMDILDDERGRQFDPYLLGRFAAMIGESSSKAPAV